MWPFGKSTKQKGFEAAQFALNMSKMELGAYMDGGRLVGAMLKDNYVLGYVTKRLQTSTIYACQMHNLDERHATALYENLLLPNFFKWEDVASIAKRTAALTDAPESGPLFGKGCDDATRMMNVKFGFKVIKDHPLYDAAVRYAEADDGSVPEAGKRMVIAASLEDLTFGRYFIEHHGVPAEREVLEKMVRVIERPS